MEGLSKMPFNKYSLSLRKQNGAVILVLLMALFIFGTSLFLGAANSNSLELRNNSEVRYQLEQAKTALLSYAQNYPSFDKDANTNGDTDDEGPGRLPCPDYDNDGLQNPSNALGCNTHVRGRLAEYIVLPSGSRFSLNDTFKGLDQQLWYVVSEDFREITGGNVNSNTAPELSLDGESGYVAIIISPGEQLGFQDRTADPNDPANYLEGVNAIDTGTSFVNSFSSPDTFNDIAVGITWSELMTAATLKVVQEVKAVMDLHHDSTYFGYEPYPYYPEDDYYYTIYNDPAYDWWEFPRMMIRATTGYSYPYPWEVTYPNNLDWYLDENWDNRINYTKVSQDSVQITFDNCAITYTVTHDAGITRDQPYC